jgi:hypothetical protein
LTLYVHGSAFGVRDARDGDWEEGDDEWWQRAHEP